eukprot:6199181-Pleurochrysis_carterae.AAC.3
MMRLSCTFFANAVLLLLALAARCSTGLRYCHADGGSAYSVICDGIDGDGDGVDHGDDDDDDVGK